MTLGHLPPYLRILILALVLAILLSGIWIVFNLAPFAPA